MADNGPKPPTAPPMPVVQRMVITLFADGNFTVEGIPSSIIQAYGMLMLAYESILTKRQREQATKGSARIVVPHGLLPPGVM